MTEEKKDLTSILDIQKGLLESGHAPPPPEGSLLEEVPVEKIDTFESLEQYSEHHPAPPSPLESETPQPAQENEFAEHEFPVSTSEEPAHEAEFETTPEEEPEISAEPEIAEEAHHELPLDFSSGESDQEYKQEALPSTESDSNFDSAAEEQEPSPVDSPSEQAQEFTSPEPMITPPKPAPTPFEKVKNFSEKARIGTSHVPASIPFSVLIIGTLLPEEKEKLLDMISREQMGIREIDLEPQLAGGKILIPRISEYAAILLVQGLRGTRAQMRMGPSDTIFSTVDTRTDVSDTFANQPNDDNEATVSSEVSHPAEQIPVTSEDRIPGLSRFKVIDTVTASAALHSNAIETDASSAYQDMVEALQRELKYKAYRKGATAIIGFKIQLITLSSPAQYRLQLMGLAIQTAEHTQSAHTTPHPALLVPTPGVTNDGEQENTPETLLDPP